MGGTEKFLRSCIVPGSATEHRLDVGRGIAGRVGPLRPRLGVVLVELVVHVLDPDGEVMPCGIQVGGRMMVWTSASVSRSSLAILVAAVCLASCNVWLVPSLSLARCNTRRIAQ